MEGTEEKKVVQRLDVLDGLRGFSILLVFLNHIDSYFIAEAVPSFLKPVIHFLFTSGNLGVTFFFILSGFLMAYLYGSPHPREFIERRYARIFPPFLTMVFCMSIFRFFPHFSLFVRVALIFSAAFVMRLIWIQVIERFQLGSILIRIFLFIQLAAAVWYGFFIMRQPPIWFSSLPFLVKEGTVSLTNATLTLPLGDYIPLLDGVYWSLVPEMIFYLLYPFLFAPLARTICGKSNWIKGLSLILLFPFFFGTSLLFKHSPGLRMLFVEYFIYFCAGIAVAYYAKHKQKIILPRVVKKIFNPVSFLILLFLSFELLTHTEGAITIAARLFISIPFSFLVLGLLDESSSLHTFFTHKYLLFLGLISYSLYIGHTALIDGIHLLFKPVDVWTNCLFLILSGTVVVGTAYVFHMIIETPYFMFKPKKKEQVTQVPNGRTAILLFIIFFIILIFATYSSQYNFFSTIISYQINSVELSAPVEQKIALSEVPLILSFTARDNNLGVILVHLTNEVGNEPAKKITAKSLLKQKLLVQVKEKNSSTLLSTQETSPAEIGDSNSYPIGIPVIKDAQSKKFIVQLSIKIIDYESTLYLHTTPTVLQTVQQIDKKTLLTHPILLAQHIAGKIITVINTKEAFIVTLCLIPFLIFLIFL